MNIEEHIKNLKKYIEEDFAFREPIKNMSDFDRYCWNHCKDIETLLTAYEKEKEENKKWKDYVVNDLENQITERNNKIFKLEAELEKEKEKNKELSNSYDKLAKECNEENRRCMLLAVENQDLKEKLLKEE